MLWITIHSGLNFLKSEDTFEENCTKAAKEALARLGDAKFFESDFFKEVPRINLKQR